MFKLVFFLVISSLSFSQIKFDDYFLDKTLRLDYYETGNKETEIFSFGELIEEPYWGGSTTQLIDELEYGYYFYKVFNKQGEVIYSRGYSTLFLEWQSTEEAKHTYRTMEGTITFPFPKDTVTVKIYKRDRRNEFHEKFSYTVDPKSYFIRTNSDYNFATVKVFGESDPHTALDFVFLPEGYNTLELGDFVEDCKKFAESLVKYAPFDEYKDKINVWAVLAPSAESGSDIPGDNVWKSTVLNSRFYTFDSERYLMTDDYHRVRDLAGNAPYDQIYILGNTTKYGGGAIYNYYSFTAAKNEHNEKVFIHELGHGLAGLADEYYTSDVSYQDYYPTDIEPWEPNITTNVDFESKWKNLMDEDTPIPTPATEEYKNKLGLFEGGGYVAKGVYRPTLNSVMKILSSPGYNKPSELAIIKILKMYTE